MDATAAPAAGVRSLCGVLMAVVAAACSSAPAPGIDPPSGCDKVYAVIAERAEDGKAAGLEVLSEEPPRLLNPRDVQRRMEDSASSLLLDTAVVYVTRLRYRVTAQGGAEQFLVVRSSGAAGFDSVAIWGVGQARFAPARVNGCPVAVWIEQDLTVQLRRNRRRAAPSPERRERYRDALPAADTGDPGR